MARPTKITIQIKHNNFIKKNKKILLFCSVSTKWKILSICRPKSKHIIYCWFCPNIHRKKKVFFHTIFVFILNKQIVKWLFMHILSGVCIVRRTTKIKSWTDKRGEVEKFNYKHCFKKIRFLLKIKHRMNEIWIPINYLIFSENYLIIIDKY
jgi:hypothetical protein